MNARLKDSVIVSCPSPNTLLFHTSYIDIEIEDDSFDLDLAENLQAKRFLNPVTTPSLTEQQRSDLYQFLKTYLLCEPEFNEDMSISSVEASDYVSRQLDLWFEELYYDEFWEGLAKDPQSINLVYAWAVENYHYTHSVCQHLPYAIKSSRLEALDKKLITHLSEEWDHPGLFRRSAELLTEHSGLDEFVTNSVPLGSTNSLKNVLVRAAAVHPFVYKACVCVLEKTATKVQETRNFFGGLAEANNIPYSHLKYIVIHAEADEAYGHTDSISEFDSIYGSLPVSVVEQALNYAMLFIETIKLWQVGMMENYQEARLGYGARV